MNLLDSPIQMAVGIEDNFGFSATASDLENPDKDFPTKTYPDGY